MSDQLPPNTNFTGVNHDGEPMSVNTYTTTTLRFNKPPQPFMLMTWDHASTPCYRDDAMSGLKLEVTWFAWPEGGGVWMWRLKDANGTVVDWGQMA